MPQQQPGGSGLSPLRLLGHGIEHREIFRAGTQQMPPVPIRIGAGLVRQFVDEAFLVEDVLGVVDAAPGAERRMGRAQRHVDAM